MSLIDVFLDYCFETWPYYHALFAFIARFASIYPSIHPSIRLIYLLLQDGPGFLPRTDWTQHLEACHYHVHTKLGCHGNQCTTQTDIQGFAPVLPLSSSRYALRLPLGSFVHYCRVSKCYHDEIYHSFGRERLRSCLTHNF